MIIVGGCPEVFVGAAIAAVDGHCVEPEVVGAVPITKFAARPSRSTFENLGGFVQSAHMVNKFLDFFQAGQVKVFGTYLLGVAKNVDKAVGEVEVFCHPSLVANFNELVAFSVA